MKKRNNISTISTNGTNNAININKSIIDMIKMMNKQKDIQDITNSDILLNELDTIVLNGISELCKCLRNEDIFYKFYLYCIIMKNELKVKIDGIQNKINSIEELMHLLIKTNILGEDYE